MHGMEFTGEFETHITVALEDTNRLGALQTWATGHGLKCLHIVLSRGNTISQPMLTWRGTGGLSSALAKALEVEAALHAARFPVTRIKIEAAPWNADIPQSEEEAKQHPSGRYFEHHIKLLLEPEADLTVLTEVAERHAAHLSRNALRLREDTCVERFVTQRCQGVSRAEAQRLLDALVQEITTRSYPILEIEAEFVVYDSNLAIDAGWLRLEE